MARSVYRVMRKLFMLAIRYVCWLMAPRPKMKEMEIPRHLYGKLCEFEQSFCKYSGEDFSIVRKFRGEFIFWHLDGSHYFVRGKVVKESGLLLITTEKIEVRGPIASTLLNVTKIEEVKNMNLVIFPNNLFTLGEDFLGNLSWEQLVKIYCDRLLKSWLTSSF